MIDFLLKFLFMWHCHIYGLSYKSLQHFVRWRSWWGAGEKILLGSHLLEKGPLAAFNVICHPAWWNAFLFRHTSYWQLFLASGYGKLLDSQINMKVPLEHYGLFLLVFWLSFVHSIMVDETSNVYNYEVQFVYTRGNYSIQESREFLLAGLGRKKFLFPPPAL